MKAIGIVSIRPLLILPFWIALVVSTIPIPTLTAMLSLTLCFDRG